MELLFISVSCDHTFLRKRAHLCSTWKRLCLGFVSTCGRARWHCGRSLWVPGAGCQECICRSRRRVCVYKAFLHKKSKNSLKFGLIIEFYKKHLKLTCCFPHKKRYQTLNICFSFLLGYYRSLYLLINSKLPSSIEYSDLPRVPIAKVLLENVLKPLHFTYKSCPEGAR